jgi:putative aldouronate transport system permease protein
MPAAKKKKDMPEGQLRFNRISPLANAVFNLLFILLALVAVVPVLVVFVISISDEAAIQEFGYRFIPKSFSLEGYKYLAEQSGMILRSLGNSVLVTVAGTAIGVILTSLMGYVLSRTEYKLQKFFSWVVFIPMVFNGGLVAQYVVNSQMLMLKNTYWALILPMCVTSFNVIVCKTFFRITIPDALIESSKIDGASQLHIFVRIVLPLSRPVLATIGLMLTFAYWNDWWLSMLYIENTHAELLTLQAFLNRLMNDITMLAKLAATGSASQLEILANMPRESARMAVAMVIVIPIAFAYPFFQRHFISGLTLGAVKG